MKCYDRCREDALTLGSDSFRAQCAKFRIMESDLQLEEVSDVDILCLSQSLSSKEDCKLVAKHLKSHANVEDESRIEVAALNMLRYSKEFLGPQMLTYGRVYKALEDALKQSDSRDLQCALIEFEDCARHTQERKKCN